MWIIGLRLFCVSTFTVFTITGSAALQVRGFVTKTSSCDEETFQLTALLFFVLLNICSGICDVIVQASMPCSSFLPGTRRALNLVAIASFLLVTIPIDDTKPADETCATFTYSADTGSCKHLDTGTMNEFWKKRCGFANQPTSHIFINSEVGSKYGFDPGAGATSYELARNVANLEPAVKNFVVTPVGADVGMSFTDYVLCLSFYTPCSASCIPLSPCSSIVKDTLSHISFNMIQDILKADCKNVLDKIPIELISVAGLEKSIEHGVLDVLKGMSASCVKAFSLIIQNTSLALGSASCVSNGNYTKAYGFDGELTGNCSAASWEKEKRDFEEDVARQRQLVETWERCMQRAIYAAHSILIASVLFSAAVFLKSPADAPLLLKYLTLSTIICCFLLLLFGVVILYICLVHFVELPSSRGYVYILSSIGCFSIWQCLVLLLLSVREKHRRSSSFESFAKAFTYF